MVNIVFYMIPIMDRRLAFLNIVVLTRYGASDAEPLDACLHLGRDCSFLICDLVYTCSCVCLILACVHNLTCCSRTPANSRPFLFEDPFSVSLY